MNKPVTLRGRVVPFDGRGRNFGYPTANIKSKTNHANGIYFGFANLNGYHKHPAIVFIGTPTTVGNTDRRIEVHLLDAADKDYYGLELNLDIKKFHRPSKTFGSIEELKIAMKDDEIAARKWFKEIS